MSLPIKQIASVPVQQPHEKVTISTLHPSLPPNDTVCGTANERIQSLNDDDIKLKTRRKTRSIQAIIAGQDESVADPPIQNLTSIPQKRCPARKYQPSWSGKRTDRHRASPPKKNPSGSLFADCGIGDQVQGKDGRAMVEAAMDKSVELLGEQMESGLDYLESLEFMAGPECLHEALDRFYIREKARRARQKARHRKKKSHKS